MTGARALQIIAAVQHNTQDSLHKQDKVEGLGEVIVTARHSTAQHTAQING